MCQIGFFFDDEKIFMENEDPKTLYNFGYKLLKDFISSFDSTFFTSIIIAFSILLFLREFYILFQITQNHNDQNKDLLFSECNTLELKNFLTMKAQRKNIFESIYKIDEKSYIRCYEKLKEFKNVKEINYEIYLNKRDKNYNQTFKNSSNYNSPNIKSNNTTAEFSNELKNINYLSPEKNTEFKSNENLTNTNNYKSRVAFPGHSNNVFVNNNNSSKAFDKSRSQNRETNFNNSKNINIIESIKVEKLNNSDKKPINFNLNNTKHKNTFSCIDAYFLSKINNAININEELSPDNYVNNDFINSDFNDNFDLKQQSQKENLKNLNIQIQFKANTSKKLIDLSILHNSKNKIAQFMNDNIKKDKYRNKFKDPNALNLSGIKKENFNNKTKNLLKTLEKEERKSNEISNAGIEFNLCHSANKEYETEEKTEKLNSLQILNANKFKNNLKSLDLLNNKVNAKNPIYNFDKHSNPLFKSEENKFQNNINILNYKSKESIKNLENINGSTNAFNINSLNKTNKTNINTNFNNNFLYSYKNIQKKARKYSDNYPNPLSNRKQEVLKIYYNNKEENKIIEIKEQNNSNANIFKGEYCNVFSQNIKLNSNNELSDNSTNNNSIKEYYLDKTDTKLKKTFNSHNKIATDSLSLGKNSTGNNRKYSHNIKNDDSSKKKINIFNINKFRDLMYKK